MFKDRKDIDRMERKMPLEEIEKPVCSRVSGKMTIKNYVIQILRGVTTRATLRANKILSCQAVIKVIMITAKSI